MTKNKMVAFIDTFEDITVLIDKKGKYKGKEFSLMDTEGNIIEKLTIQYHSLEPNFLKFGLKSYTSLELTKEYYILDDLRHMIPLYSGSVVRTTEFESLYFYDGPLGIEYSPEKTTFRVWSPVAREIRLKLIYGNGKEDIKYLSYGKKGLWSITITGDLEGVGYLYEVKVFSDYVSTLDPYAIASTANHEYNYVIDLKKTYQMKNDIPEFSGYYTDAVLYEASIRDMTCQLESDKKGTYLGMLENQDGISNIEYIKSLGITHLQLMPVFDFGGVDDTHKNDLYNWGYNPEQYFVPSGWYSSNPCDPYSRINEYKELIDLAHKNGLRVVMDVVFNHVYKVDYFPFDVFVPGYFYRVDLYGNATNTSGCGNDLATEKRMCSRFIIDNLKYWAKEYKISGFRFDLMGLLDIETLNQAYDELKLICPDIMLYGEGWNMPNTIPDAYRPHSYNHYKMPHFAFFNDKFRDTIKGSQWNSSVGYAFGHRDSDYDIFHLLSGSSLDHYRFSNPYQSVNYVECHDNYTIYDYAKKLGATEEEALDGARLALQMVCISEGIPFIHAGEEFYRSKKGIENSYIHSDEYNCFDLKRRALYQSTVCGIRDLLTIRKQYPEFRMKSVMEMTQNLQLVKEWSDDGGICYQLLNKNYILTVCIKNSKVEKKLLFASAEMIFDGHKKCSIMNNEFRLNEIGVFIFKETI